MKNTGIKGFFYKILIMPALIILFYLSGCTDGYNSRVNVQGMRVLGEKEKEEKSHDVDWDNVLNNGNDIDELLH